MYAQLFLGIRRQTVSGKLCRLDLAGIALTALVVLRWRFQRSLAFGLGLGRY